MKYFVNYIQVRYEIQVMKKIMEASNIHKGIKIIKKNKRKMKCRYILTFLRQNNFVFEEDHQKDQNISTFHVLFIFLVIFIPYK